MDNVAFLLKWFSTPNGIFGGVTPLEMLKMGRGDRVAQYIEEAAMNAVCVWHRFNLPPVEDMAINPHTYAPDYVSDTCPKCKRPVVVRG